MDTQVHFREPGSVDEDLHTGRVEQQLVVSQVFLKCQIQIHLQQISRNLKKIDIGKGMYCNHAFYFGATAENFEILEKLKDLEGCCGIKLFAGSSTGNYWLIKKMI